MTHYNRVEPTHTTRTACSCSVFTTNFSNLISYCIKQFSWEGTFTNTRSICFSNPYYFIKAGWNYTSTYCCTSRNWVRRLHVRIYSFINSHYVSLLYFTYIILSHLLVV